MYHHIAELSDLAPLHNAAALRLIRTISEQLPTSIPLAFFDTSFHSTLPPHVRTYPISPARAQKNKLRKYGFHGLSYASILRHTSASLGKAKERVSIIALHLGSGASACAIRDGASLDTSMGITPLAGLPGATRSGSVDPSLVFHYTHNAGKPSRAASKELHVTRAEEILNKECGWKALAGTTDFGVVSEGRSEEARLAFDIFVDRVVGFVGSYFVKLGGRVDALVFAGGIGEKGAKLRREVVRAVECLGYGVDEGKNEAVGKGDEEGVVVEIGKEGCRRVLVVKTDEQSEMALGCMEVAGKIEAAK
ncbi:Acetokinase family-domain-containing protein [Lineolata rhizophorae]|uniref:Probable acetate kinase n=1 Tax=Lineolata rhizophorae TaxID=578093 RepID=A0A6A6NXJ0_9PEZI|nr:Acetokinase family-domain-containing protein [Lineolata rhizophorae]